MTDQEHADAIKQAADRLAEAMNAAANGGLHVSVLINSTGYVTDEHGSTRYCGFSPRVDVTRVVVLSRSIA
jgi:hypothetical protein